MVPLVTVDITCFYVYFFDVSFFVFALGTYSPCLLHNMPNILQLLRVIVCDHCNYASTLLLSEQVATKHEHASADSLRLPRSFVLINPASFFVTYYHM